MTDEAEELMNKIRDEIDADKLKDHIVAKHVPAMRDAFKMLPAEELVKCVIQGIFSRNDLTARQLHRMQQSIGTVLWEVMRTEE